MKIQIEPTGSFEVFKGVQFRLYRGVTNAGIPLQFLGMFRINDPLQRQQFEEEIGAVPIEGRPTPLIKTPRLVNP